MNRKTLIISTCLIIIILLTCLTLLQPFNQNSFQNTKTKWSKTFGGDEEDTGSFVLSTNDGGCIVTGYTESYGSGKGDIW